MRNTRKDFQSFKTFDWTFCQCAKIICAEIHVMFNCAKIKDTKGNCENVRGVQNLMVLKYRNGHSNSFSCKHETID